MARLVLLAACALPLAACSVRSVALSGIADLLQRSSLAYAQDDDPELIEDALPFLLKTVEGLLLEDPTDQELLLVASSGYASYAQAFVAEPADLLEEDDLQGARRQRRRAGRLFLRARGYGLRALEAAYPGMASTLESDPTAALARARRQDVPLLFWIGAAWAGAINVSRDEMDLVADLDIADAILQRANELDPGWDQGSIHELLIAIEAARSGGQGGSLEAAREHFEAAVRLSGGRRVGPWVQLAESVHVREQNLTEFTDLLERALAFDLESAPEARLANTLAQRKARWLLGRRAHLFVEFEEDEE
ncbi:MAG: TRAP transporter TatT component family protein [Planctomycetota bacterium]